MTDHKDREQSGLELHHIDVVAPDERHGKPRDLFPVWFSANLSIGNAVFGALAIAVGNSFWWAVLAVVVGNVVGGVFMALHSVQGARLGVPQLIQSRGQFGFHGALLPVALAAFLYCGFFIVTALVSGQAIAAAAPSLFDINSGMLWLSLISLGLALLGYRAIHLAAKWAMWPLAVVVVIVTLAIIIHGGSGITAGEFKAGPFFTAVGLMATFLLTYAPYVSDYSRYLPVNSSARGCFGWTFAGAFISATWCNLLGVVLALQFTDGDVFASTREVLGSDTLAAVILLATAVAIAGNNALNLYGGMLNLITAVSSFVTVRPALRTRIVMLLPTFAVGLLIGLSASDNFYAELSNFLSMLMLGFVPWGAINLLDFYFVRHGNYDVPAFFDRSRRTYVTDPARWTYHGFNLKSLSAYAVGIVCAIPFVGNGWYMGPVSERLGGADLSWVPGLIVTGAVYLALSRSRRTENVEAPAGLAEQVG